MNRPQPLLAKGTARWLCSYLKFVGPGLDVRIRYESSHDSEDRNRFLSTDAPTSAIHTLWIADHVNLLSLAFASAELKRVAKDLRFFVDDSFGGLVMQSSLKRLDLKTLPISDQNPAERLRSLRRVVEHPPRVSFLAVDGRGPYFQVKSGIVNLALLINARIVPTAIVSRPAITLPLALGGIAIPTPGAHITVLVGRQIQPIRGVPANETTSELQKALLRARSIASNELDKDRPVTAAS